jgi:hypothetical protein
MLSRGLMQVNAFILHETYYQRDLNDQFEFRLTLIDAMLREAGIDTAALMASRRRRSTPARPLVTEEAVQHSAVMIPHHAKRGTGDLVSTRRVCVYCSSVRGERHETTIMCVACDAALCVSERDCFRLYHVKQAQAHEEV